jgi:hypothetical protein
MPLVKVTRPFTGMVDTGVKFEPKKILQSAALASIPEDDLRHKLYANVKDVESQSSLAFGKSIINSMYKETTKPSIITI